MAIPTIPGDHPTIAPIDYTVAQFERDIIDIILRHPDNQNPRRENAGGCAYQRLLPEGQVQRCLIGQWIHERGHEYRTQWDAPMSATAVLQELGYEPAVAQRAETLQNRADASTPPWREVLRLPA